MDVLQILFVAAGQAQYSQQGAIDQFCDQPLGVSKSTPPDKLKELPNQPDAYCAQINTEKKNPNNLEGTSSEKVTDVNADFDEATRSLQCDGVITIAPNSIYTLTAQIKTLDEVLSPYALWILPAFYGALGAIMFHMRMILNPLLPNPPLSRLIHRIALGALAGMVLAWFVAPGTKLGEEASGIGFSLFTFSFLFGFSLDIFFTILDQFVSMSVAGIKKFGSSTVA
ncbi:hypothetical protein [Mesorhizobium sp. LSJC264A00]|uniref:hypothetical protein n=1 Tax=unclassified Mesorhizobium TaxID=325217 RepID=UPI0012EBC719|nr:hypothetical protein [Mesorhizobium sp. LSJC264A00]